MAELNFPSNPTVGQIYTANGWYWFDTEEQARLFFDLSTDT